MYIYAQKTSQCISSGVGVKSLIEMIVRGDCSAGQGGAWPVFINFIHFYHFSYFSVLCSILGYHLVRAHYAIKM